MQDSSNAKDISTFELRKLSEGHPKVCFCCSKLNVLAIMEFNAEDHTSKEKDIVLLISALKKKVETSKFAGSVVPRTDVQFLTAFIRTKDYDLDAAFASVQKYYICIQKNIDIMTDLTPSLYETAFRSRMLVILKHSFNGSRAAIFRFKDWSTMEVNTRGVQVLSLFVAEHYINNCLQIQHNGLAVVFDMEGYRFEHLRQCSLKETLRVIHVAQDGIPLRIAAIHILHVPSYFRPIFQLLLRFLKEKIRKRVHIHSSYESLHQHLSKENLPQSVGGDLNEEEAIETHVMEYLLDNNIPYEKFWNGEIEPNPPFL